MNSENGILASVPGEDISGGSRQLPRPGPEQEACPERKVVVAGVRDLGTVRITYQLQTYRHRRSRRRWPDPDGCGV